MLENYGGQHSQCLDSSGVAEMSLSPPKIITTDESQVFYIWVVAFGRKSHRCFYHSYAFVTLRYISLALLGGQAFMGKIVNQQNVLESMTSL